MLKFSNNLSRLLFYQQNILFSSETSGDWQIWQLHLATGKLSQLTKNGGYSVQGDLASGFLYLSKFNFSGLYRLNLATGEEEGLIEAFKITDWNKWQLRSDSLY